MNKTNIKCLPFSIFIISLLFLIHSAVAQEVDKGKIPKDQLTSSFTTLSWGCPIWDVDQAVAYIKKGNKALWIDTKPESFFKAGTVKDAILLPYNKTGKKGNIMTQDTLAAAPKDKGLEKDQAEIIMFCQGPECHRSYNATYIAVSQWGYNPEKIVWFRAGYPHLLKEVKNNPKLKRKAKKYLSDAGLKSL